MIGMHAETTSSDSPYSSCKILTAQDEFDVLPMVCELARSYGKVVCYLAYSLSIITLYKELVSLKPFCEEITETGLYRFKSQLALKSWLACMDPLALNSRGRARLCSFYPRISARKSYWTRHLLLV
ncbi:hypothetical protein BDV93DRAFT_334701 [Ceratobasidium sp. AG-I]|nr:hypothetical protein BDV93DRAFT_334701 [Ceratobasidium sp. AG-I]